MNALYLDIHRKYFELRKHSETIMKEDISDNYYKVLLRNQLYYNQLLDRIYDETTTKSDLIEELEHKLLKCKESMETKGDDSKFRIKVKEYIIYNNMLEDIQKLIKE